MTCSCAVMGCLHQSFKLDSRRFQIKERAPYWALLVNYDLCVSTHLAKCLKCAMCDSDCEILRTFVWSSSLHTLGYSCELARKIISTQATIYISNWLGNHRGGSSGTLCRGEGSQLTVKHWYFPWPLTSSWWWTLSRWSLQLHSPFCLQHQLTLFQADN